MKKVWLKTQDGIVLRTNRPDIWPGSKRLTEAEAKPLVREQAIRQLDCLLRTVHVYVVHESKNRVRLYARTAALGSSEGLRNITAWIAQIEGLRYDGGNWLQCDPRCLKEHVESAIPGSTIERL